LQGDILNNLSMRFILYLLISVLSLVTASAQTSYSDAIQQGDAAFKNGAYKKAINKYFAAEAFDPAKKQQVKAKVNKVFDSIEALRARANKALQEALAAKRKTGRALLEAEKQANIAKANDLRYEAQKVLETDPTLALRLLEASLKIYSTPAKQEEARQLYQGHSFYKNLLAQTEYQGAVKISPKHRLALIADNGGNVSFFDWEGRFIKRFPTHPDMPSPSKTHTYFTPDGKGILVSFGETIRGLTLDGNLMGGMYVRGVQTSPIEFSPDGNSLLVGTDDGKLWWHSLKADSTIELPLCKTPQQLQDCNTSAIVFTKFSPDGQNIFVVRQDSTTLLYNIAEHTVTTLDISHKVISTAIFSPNSDKIFISYKDQSVEWVTTKKKRNELFTNPLEPNAYDTSPNKVKTKIEQITYGNSTYISAAAYSPSGDMLLLGTSSGLVFWVDLNDYSTQLLTGHQYPVSQVAYMENGSIISVAEDNTVKQWYSHRAYTKQAISTQQKLIQWAIPSPDGKRILVKYHTGSAALAELNGQTIKLFEGQAGNQVDSAWFSHRGNHLLLRFTNGAGALFNNVGDMVQTVNATGERMTCAAFSAASPKMAIATDNNMVRLFTIGTSTYWELPQATAVTALGLSADGGYLAVATVNGKVVIHHFETGDSTVFKTQQPYIQNLLFSPDIDKLLVGSSSHQQELFDLKQKNPEMQSAGMLCPPYCTPIVSNPRFSADGQSILYMTQNGFYSMELQTRSLRFAAGIGQNFTAGAFSTDGKTMITTTADKTVQLWNVPLSLEGFLKSKHIELLSAAMKKKYNVQ
jgi:WD40 repeat protein